MDNVIQFSTARPVLRRHREEEYRALIRRHWAFYLRGDSYMAAADKIATAAGYAFNCHKMPKNAPEAVHALMAKAARYDQQSRRYYRRAEEIARELWSAALHRSVDPRGAA